AARRAAARRHEAARSLLGAWQARARRTSRPPASQPPRRLATPARRDRRPLTFGLRRAPPRPGRRQLRPLPRTSAHLVPRTGRHGRAGPDRQRQGLPLTRLERGRTARTAQAPLHPHLPAAHERQSRAPHPDAAAGVGLRPQLPLEQPPRTRPPRLPTLVQQTPTAQRARRPTPNQPRLTPPWSRQLANRVSVGEHVFIEPD